jgi:hypothetical protein
LLAAVVGVLQNAGITLADGFIQTREFLADKITAKKVVAEVLEMKDSTTGDTYCVSVANGEWAKNKGTCGEAAPSVSVVMPPTSSATSATEPVATVSPTDLLVATTTAPIIASDVLPADTATTTPPVEVFIATTTSTIIE